MGCRRVEVAALGDAEFRSPQSGFLDQNQSAAAAKIISNLSILSCFDSHRGWSYIQVRAGS